jgi:site-specific recombinase XerD
MSLMPKRPRRRNWRRAMGRLEGAYAPNTLRSYRADFEIFEAWCAEAGKPPLPASPRTVAAFITDQQNHVGATTLRRRQAAIRKIHRLLRLPNPADGEDVMIAIRRAKRAKGRRPQQALGLTDALRNRLIEAAPNTLTGLRNIALISVGYDTLCRRAELSALRLEDTQALADGSRSILVRRAKNDPFADGRLGLLSPTTLAHVNRWLAAAGIGSGWIFRRVQADGTVGDAPLDPASINRILKTMAADAALDATQIARLSGHSMRVGAAQDMMTSGLGILAIMQAGGWKSLSVVSRYVEHVELSALAHLREKRGIGGGV